MRRVVPFSQRSVNQKAREHSQRSKTGRVCGKRRRERSAVMRHTRRAVQWWQNMEFCALLHIKIGTLSLLSFIYRVFLPVLVLSVYASKPGNKWLVPRATTSTADDPNPFGYSAIVVLIHLTSMVFVAIQELDNYTPPRTGNLGSFGNYSSIYFNVRSFKEFKRSRITVMDSTHFNFIHINVYTS